MRDGKEQTIGTGQTKGDAHPPHGGGTMAFGKSIRHMFADRMRVGGAMPGVVRAAEGTCFRRTQRL